MTTDGFGTPPMFEKIPDTPFTVPYNDVSGGSGPIRYAKYRPKKPVKCDDCMGAFIGNPSAPASRPAAFKRTQQGANTLLLCHAHTRLRKQLEYGHPS